MRARQFNPFLASLREIPLCMHPPGCAGTPGFLNRRTLGHHDAKRAGESRTDPALDKSAIQ